MVSELTLRLENRRSEVRRLRLAVEGYCAEHGVGPDATTKLVLVLEELVTNAVEHAYDGARRGQIDVTLSRQADRLRLVVEDDGRPFDPLTAPVVSLTGPPEDRAVGGIGLHLVRELLAAARYDRRDGRNRVEGSLGIR